MKMVEGGELPDAEDSMLAQVGVHPMCDDAGLDADPRDAVRVGRPAP